MTECPYCIGNNFMAELVGTVSRVEVNIVTEGIPHIDVKVNRYDGILTIHSAFNINYCPMCGRRLTPHNA